MKKRNIFKSMIIILAIVMTLMPVGVYCKAATLKLDNNTVGMTKAEATAYKKMLALKKTIPEGKKWTNSTSYKWKGGYYSKGYGCAAFAFKLSDAAFGSKKCKTHKNFNNIKVGDVLEIDYGNHVVIVMKVVGKKLVIAEGNYNKKVHWGRVITLKEVKKTGVLVLTRW